MQMSPESLAAKGSSSARPNAPRRPSVISTAPDMVETFADSVTGLMFDDQTLRIEFGVTRFDDVKPNAPITARRYPACRLSCRRPPPSI